MIVNTLKANSLDHLNDILEMANVPNTLILCFVSADIDHPELYNLLTKKGYVTVTYNTPGHFLDGKVLYSGITCMTLELPKHSFKLKRFDFDTDLFEVGHKIGQFAQNAYEEADALIFATAYSEANYDILLQGFDDGCDHLVSVFGGIAGSNHCKNEGMIGIDGRVSYKSVGVVVFDKSKISLQGLVVGGWKPIGTYKTITKSVGNKVYEMDNRPVKEVYEHYFEHQEDSPVSKYLEFPLQITHPDGSVVIRVISSIERDYFCYTGEIKEGAKVYFCTPLITEVIGRSVNNLNDFQKSNELMDCDAVLAFSCIARLYSFGFHIQNELRSFNEMWSSKHMGSFGFGEIGRCSNGESLFHNNAVSVVFFKDLTAPNSTPLQSKDLHYQEKEIQISASLDKNFVIEILQEQKLTLANLLQRTSLDLNNALRELDQYKNGLEHKVEEQLTDIKELNTELIDTQKEVIFTMGSIAESRSKETGNHVARVAEYCRVFALEIGLEEEEVELIMQASPMHDIGKVGIPDAILNKPGKLTTDEFEIMKTHGELGYSMFKHSNRPLLKVAATIAHEHHEKWDGTGYPRGLAGNDIHLYGRITAIADVFDALGSDRCYKKAWNDQDIWKLLREQRGKHFDPMLVDIFFEKIEIFKAIRKKFKDI